MLPANPSSDPFSLGPVFQGEADGSALSPNSSISEPEPGEPLSDESEKLLAGETEDAAPENDSDAAPAAPVILMPPILFSAEKTEAVLVEIFDWLADRFDSEHWKLTENQAAMLGEPTAQLLGGVWTKLAERLPDILVNTPGAAAFLLAVTVVVVPKTAQQIAISRARKQGRAPQKQQQPRPVAVPNRRPAPRTEFNPADAPVPDAGGANDFVVTGD